MRTPTEWTIRMLASARRRLPSEALLGPRRCRLIVERLERRDHPSGFPFTIAGSQFLRDGVPVFLNAIGYQPLEPGQAIADAIRETRVQDDLRRLADFRGGPDPLLLRVYAQPTAQLPIRMPKSFYDGLRHLGMYVVRDIYFQDNYLASDALAKGRANVDAVINEVASVGAMDRIFAWEIGNEFRANTAAEVAGLQDFLGAMRTYIKARLAEPGREGCSNWVTWASWPPADPLRTDGTRFVPPDLDYYSINAYSYDPERIRDHQAGPVTGTPYAGYLAALKAQLPDKPLVISETGLPDSPSAVGTDQESLPPLAPSYRRGHLTDEQVAEGLADRYWDIRLSGVVAGFSLFEWNDEWHKVGNPTVHDDHPEEYFGIVRFDTDPIEARSKLQLETVRDLFTMQLPAAAPVITGLSAQSTTLSSAGTTTIRALVSPDAVGPVRFRWEASRGVIVGDSDTVQFDAAGRALGTATVTAVAIDARGHATRESIAIAITPSGSPGLEALTLGTQRASGQVTNVDLDQFQVVAYIQTNQLYVQPYTDAKSIWVGPDGYWWTPVFNGFNGQLVAWVVPKSYDPPLTLPIGSSPPGAIAMARLAFGNDADNNLLPDPWQPASAPGRYADPDGDGANNLEEFLAHRSPTVPDNDDDSDGLPDTWERRFFGTSSADNAGDDPDGDGLTNRMELDMAIHPGRTAVDRDRDGLPDNWERRTWGNLTPRPDDDPDGDGRTIRDAYELDLAQVVDDGNAGWSTTGSWFSYPDPGGFQREVRFAPAGSGDSTATWTFAVTPGKTYRVSATWTPHPNRATDAPFTVLDGVRALATLAVNQEQAPGDYHFGSADWEELGGPYTVGGTALVVQLGNKANEYVIADAVRIEEVAPAPSSIQLVDDGDTGWSTTGSWFSYPDPTAFQGDVHFALAGSGDSTAGWTFAVTPGKTYRVSATWTPHPNRATNAPYTILDGATALAVLAVNQELTPGDYRIGGIGWEDLGGPYTVSGSTLVVRLTNVANEYVIADGVRIEEVSPTPSSTQLVDDANTGWSTTGSWFSYPDPGGYQGDVHFAPAGSGANTAGWTFAVTPGKTYRVSATWTPHPNRATNAPFTVFNGTTPLATVPVNQELVPGDYRIGGIGWKDLGGPYTASGTTLVVRLSDAANEYVIADALRIEEVGTTPLGGPLAVDPLGSSVALSLIDGPGQTAESTAEAASLMGAITTRDEGGPGTDRPRPLAARTSLAGGAIRIAGIPKDTPARVDAPLVDLLISTGVDEFWQRAARRAAEAPVLILRTSSNPSRRQAQDVPRRPVPVLSDVEARGATRSADRPRPDRGADPERDALAAALGELGPVRVDRLVSRLSS
jgi:hypothetical protein